MRKSILTKAASLLALLMLLSAAMPLLASASVWFKDVEYVETSPGKGTVSGSVYSAIDLEATVGKAVYVALKNMDGNTFTVGTATYSHKTDSYYFYDFSVSDVTYDPIFLEYYEVVGVDIYQAVTDAVYRASSGDGGGDDRPGDSTPGPGSGSDSGTGSDNQGADGTIVITVGNEVAAAALERAFAARPDVIIEVKDGNVSLPVGALKAAAAKAGTSITVKSDNGTYTLPLSVLNFDELAAELGVELDDMKIVVNISKADAETVEAITTRGSELGLEFVADAIDFEVYAEDQDGNKVMINSFGDTYVSRSIPLHESVDTNKTTGVVYDPNTGEFRFVPSVFSEVDGQTIATFMRNTNSVYTVVTTDKSFTDVPEGRWSTEDIHLLANKLIVAGITESEFGPKQDITRAEFAALLVRSLGLPVGNSAASFSDVDENKWYAAEIAAAVDAGLVYGYAEDNTFRPDRNITRAEIAAMVVRAMAYAGTEVELADGEQATLLGQFSDADQIRWGQAEVAAAVKAGIVAGMDNGQIWPGTSASREQAASMIARYLVYVGFINE